MSRKKELLIHLNQYDRNQITNNTIWDRVHSILHDSKRMQKIKERLNLMKIEENGELAIISVRYNFKPLQDSEVFARYRNANTRLIICSYEGSLVADQESLSNTFAPENDIYSMKMDSQ